jgi:hypothetical protein
VDAGDSWRQLYSRTRLKQDESSHGIDPHQSIVVGEIGGNQSSKKSKRDGFTRVAASIISTYRINVPMIEFLKGDPSRLRY